MNNNELPTFDELILENRFFKFQTTHNHNSSSFQYFRFERSADGIHQTGLNNMDTLYPPGMSSSRGTWARLSGSDGSNKYHYKIIEVDEQGDDVTQLSTGNSNTYQAPDWSLNVFKGTGSSEANSAHGEFNPVTGSEDWLTTIVKHPDENKWYFVLAKVYSGGNHGTTTLYFTDHRSRGIYGYHFSNNESVSTWRVFETLQKGSLKPVITLIGNSEVTHSQGTVYTDAGATATNNSGQNIDNSMIIVSGKPTNQSNIGTYTVKYNLRNDGFDADEVVRTVVVEDKTSPTITLIGGSNITHQLDNEYIDQGATAIDNVDSNITVTNSLTNELKEQMKQMGTYTIIYTASDTVGNTSSKTRTVVVEPHIGPDANLRNADLRNVNLIGADLRNADLRNADLRNVDLSYGNLDSADLTDADLEGTNLTGVNLTNTILIGVNLSSVNLTGFKFNAGKWCRFDKPNIISNGSGSGSSSSGSGSSSSGS